jgi:hypothetical protein
MRLFMRFLLIAMVASSGPAGSLARGDVAGQAKAPVFLMIDLTRGTAIHSRRVS